MSNKGVIHIGTSGWSYDHWVGPWYPEDLAAGDRLGFYADRFSSAEINNSFYNLPSEKTLRQWYDTVPKDFVFTAKASRYITHMKKLKDPADSIETFLSRIRVLDDKLGPILFQLPPTWGFDEERLEHFLKALPGDFRYAFEFRDHSWHNQAAYSLLEKHDAAFCIYDLAGFLSPREVTTDFVYLRLHGPSDKYQGRYDANTLSGWAGALSAWSRKDIDVYAYFDNDDSGYAALNAQELAAMFD